MDDIIKNAITCTEMAMIKDYARIHEMSISEATHELLVLGLNYVGYEMNLG